MAQSRGAGFPFIHGQVRSGVGVDRARLREIHRDVSRLHTEVPIVRSSRVDEAFEK
jgi:hypothetical protein